jgi:glucose-6-phosphate 1-dehydrogenase
VEPIMKYWSTIKHEFPNYPAGSWGPKASDDMLARHGHEWRKP